MRENSAGEARGWQGLRSAHRRLGARRVGELSHPERAACAAQRLGRHEQLRRRRTPSRGEGRREEVVEAEVETEVEAEAAAVAN